MVYCNTLVYGYSYDLVTRTVTSGDDVNRGLDLLSQKLCVKEITENRKFYLLNTIWGESRIRNIIKRKFLPAL